MARLKLHSDRLEISLTTAEKVLALHKGSLVVPRESIRSATITDDPWIWVRGIRAPGAAVPLTLAVGKWKFHGGQDFLVIKGTRPAVVIDIDGGDYSRIIVTTSHALDLVKALRLDEKPVAKKPRTRTAKPQQLPGARKRKTTPKPLTEDAGAEKIGTETSVEKPVSEAMATPNALPDEQPEQGR